MTICSVNSYALPWPGMAAPLLEQGRVTAVLGVADKAAPYDEADLRQLQLFMGQEAQAKKALFLLRGRVGTTGENLAEALQETRELAVDALAWTDRAQAGGDRPAGALLMQMARVQASHLAAYERQAEGETVFHVCPVCGYIHVSARLMPIVW